MTRQERGIRKKVGLLKLAEELGNVSQACKIIGYSRYSFYRFKELYEQGGELALQEIRRRQHCTRNRLASEIEEMVCRLALEKPALGQLRISNELRSKGIFVSPSGVRSVWQRHDLETFPKRLKAPGISDGPGQPASHRRAASGLGKS